MKRVLLVCALAGGIAALAQTGPPPAGVVVMQGGGMVGPPGEPIFFDGGGGPSVNFEFVATEMSFDARVVKGAPYSAQAITETRQTLSDGNHIDRKAASAVYRDSEGRTRREQTLGAIGALLPAGGEKQMIFINDPVAGVNYVLDPADRTARKMTLPRPGSAAGHNVMYKALAPPPGAEKMRQQFKNESLGTQTIEGVAAEGKRSTVTIPAGQIGNEQPIEIVSERWFSPQLKIVVMSRHTDPRMGETTYRLTNVSQGEPARSLFEAPAGYTITGEKPHIEPFRGPGPPR